MLRKIGLLVLASVISVGAFYQPALAVSSSPLLNGQHHYYTVQMRNDDQAITYAKIVFQNGDSETNRKTVEFSLPEGVSVSNLSVQQILSKQTVTSGCDKYETFEEWSERTGESTYYAPTVQQSRYEAGKRCLVQSNSSAYNEDYDFVTNSSNDEYNTYYYYSRYQTNDDFEYSDLTLNEKDGKYTINLATEVKPKKQGAILVSYTSKDYVSGLMGRFTYDYRTLATDEMIDSATASISFDEGLYSRTAKQERTSSESAATSIEMGATAADSSYESKSLDSLQYSVGTGGTVTKTQSKMLPGDIMSVTGVYATSPIALFGKEILIGLIVAALIGVGIWRFIVYHKKHRKVSPKKDTKTLSNEATDEISWENAPKIFQQETESLAKLTIGRMIAVSAVSIGSTVMVVLLIIAVGSAIATGDSYYYSYNYIFNTYVPAFAALVVVYGLFISPLAYVLRFGVKPAFIWTLVQSAFGVIGLIVVLMLAVALGGDNSGGGILDIM